MQVFQKYSNPVKGPIGKPQLWQREVYPTLYLKYLRKTEENFMIIIKRYKKLLSVTLLTAVAMFTGTAMGKYIPYTGPAVAPAPAEAIEKATETPKEDHSAQALEHATAAATHGKAGHASILSEHAKVALEHAQAAEKVLEGEPKAHMSEAITHLNEAIKHGDMGHADVATEHVNQAITHIKASIGK